MHFIERKSPLEKLPTGCVRGQLPYKRERDTQPKSNLQESDEERVEAGQFEGSQSVSGHCEQSALKQSGIEFAGFAAFAIVVKSSSQSSRDSSDEAAHKTAWPVAAEE
jgi:hypothetical protein